MRIKLWGTRGSLPAPVAQDEVRTKIRESLLLAKGVDLTDPNTVDAFIDRLPFHIRGTQGGNTPCVEVRNSSDDLIIIDAGTGIRQLGASLLKQEFGKGKGAAHILLSHSHWDHIQGFPFFAPAYVPGNRFTIWGKVPGGLRKVFTRQQSPPFFPAPLEAMRATLDFRTLPRSREMQLCEGRFTVRYLDLDHPGVSRAFRIEADGVSFVYASDAQYKHGDAEGLRPYINFFREADVLAFDAQFTIHESSFEKRDWGHSAAPVGVELACAAEVKRLILFHHDPRNNDVAIAEALHNARAYAHHVPRKNDICIDAAYDGLELVITPS